MEERENIDTWQGIREERFRRYKSWVTPSGYLCGTYAATVFLAYYQDYIDEQIIPKTVRRKNQLQPGALTDILRLLIQPHGLPTIAWQVAHGLSRFFTHLIYLIGGVPQFSAAGSEPANGSIKANR